MNTGALSRLTSSLRSCVFPVLAQAFTQNWWGLLICRMLMGFGMGVKITTIPIMTSETAPAIIRGGLVMSFQLWVAFGE